MNLNELFEAQRKLDEHIIEKKQLQGQDLLPKKILALQVELGELAQNWRGFKFWSTDRAPRTERKVICHSCKGLGEHHLQVFHGVDHVNDEVEVCLYCEGTGWQENRNPLLEEYVDYLHFILSIGLDLKTTNIVIDSDYTGINATETFIIAFETTVELANAIREWNKSYIYQVYEELFNLFVGLGEKYLGFAWEQVEQAYLDKNKINHERQMNNY